MVINNDLISRIRRLEQFIEVSSDRFAELSPVGVFFSAEPEVTDKEVEPYLFATIRKEEIKFDYDVLKPVSKVRSGLDGLDSPSWRSRRRNLEFSSSRDPEAFEKKEVTRTELKIDGGIEFAVQSASELDDILFAIINIRETHWNSSGYARLENHYDGRHAKLAQYGKQKCIEAYLKMAQEAAKRGDESQTTTYLTIALEHATTAISNSPQSTMVQLASGINPYKEVVRIEGLLEKTLGGKPNLNYDPLIEYDRVREKQVRLR